MAEEWSPESENAPEKTQREILELGKKLLEQSMEAKKREEAYAALPPPAIPAIAFKIPTFDEVSERCRETWARTKEIAGDAPPEVQAQIFGNLMHSPRKGEPGLPA